jgi:hypothetical protein
MLCYVMLCYVMLCYVMLCCVVLCWAVMSYNTLCCYHVVLCDAISCQVLFLLCVHYQPLPFSSIIFSAVSCGSRHTALLTAQNTRIIIMSVYYLSLPFLFAAQAHLFFCLLFHSFFLLFTLFSLCSTFLLVSFCFCSYATIFFLPDFS